MNTKLTLSLDKEVIEKAKRYAKKNGQSVSGMVENYFKLVSSNDQNRKSKGNKRIIEITPLVKSLKTTVKFPKDFDYKEALTEALREKYCS
ncbi:MAG: hypothetical protein IIA88_07220 [Bacteroidetes bacterium]|nr:hypothetical protein [Bacteroidota bacterium]